MYDLILQGANVIEQRIVHCGKFWSSGGVTSGLDLCLAFINNDSGKEEAGKVQLLLEYFPSSTNYADLNQIKELPPINSPEGLLEDGAQNLPNYILESYFK